MEIQRKPPNFKTQPKSPAIPLAEQIAAVQRVRKWAMREDGIPALDAAIATLTRLKESQEAWQAPGTGCMDEIAGPDERHL